MINKLEITGYKNIDHQVFNFKPITILTGLNSTGKSSVLQTILHLAKETSFRRQNFSTVLASSFDVIRNKYTNASEISISCSTDMGDIKYTLNRAEKIITPQNYAGIFPECEQNLFYLSANRKGVENIADFSEDVICGFDGGFIYSTYEKEKSKALENGLIKDNESHTLAAQVNYWLRYILNLQIELYTLKNSSEKVDVRFKSDGFTDMIPSQLGSGVSYLVRILILCLRAAKGDIILIENPEIHLHPGAQSRLADFFTMVANYGVQIVIETHCENLLNKFCYEVYKKELNDDNIVIFYKSGIIEPYEEIRIDKRGGFVPDFPEGFFDATLSELLEME